MRRLLPLQSAALTLAALICCPAAAQEGGDDAAPLSLRLAVGFEFATGEYGGTGDIDTYYVPTTLTLSQGDLSLAVTVPYLSIDGPGRVIGAGETAVILDRPIAGRREEADGLGDVIVAVGYALHDFSDENLFIDLSARVKLPTAEDDEGLGTGESDIFLSADVSYAVDEALLLFVNGGYRFTGEPDGLELDDGAFGSIGLQYAFSDELAAGLSLDVREALVADVDDAAELFAFLSYDLSEAVSLNLYGLYGLTDASPDAGFGAQISVAPADLPLD